MRFLRRSLTGLFLISLTVALLALAGQVVRSAIEERAAEESAPGTARERVFAVNVVAVTSETVAPVLEAFGEVRARRALELRVQVGGPVVELGPRFEDGGRVAAGELLLRVDANDLEDALALAQTDLAEAEAEVVDAAAALEIARDDLASAEDQAELRAGALARQRDLARRGLGTEAAVETAALAAAGANQAVLSRRSALANASARAAQADNALARRKIALAEAARRLSETNLTANFAGTLSGVAAVEGRIVTANEQVATLVDPTQLEVSFRLSLAQYARLLDAGGELTGAEVNVRLAVSGVALEAAGRIDRESAEVGEGQTGRLIYARLDSAAGFRPGDFVTVEIREPALDDVARLPSSALGNGDSVLVLGDEDRLEQVAVEVLRRRGDTVLIRAGDLAGREVVAERTPMLGAGIGVRPFREGDETNPVADGASGGGGGMGGGGGGGGDDGEAIALDDEKRAALIEFVNEAYRMKPQARERIIYRLNLDEVPVQLVERLDKEMGS